MNVQVGVSVFSVSDTILFSIGDELKKNVV